MIFSFIIIGIFVFHVFDRNHAYRDGYRRGYDVAYDKYVQQPRDVDYFNFKKYKEPFLEFCMRLKERDPELYESMTDEQLINMYAPDSNTQVLLKRWYCPTTPSWR